MPILTAEERIGTVIAGRYELARILSDEGGMGIVFVAVHRGTGHQVAFKCLRPEWARDASIVRRFQDEARIAANFQHPNVVKVLDLGDLPDAGGPFLVMDLLRGESLARRIERKRRLSSDEMLASVLPVLKALAVAHGRGIVHRDLKPANIFLAVDDAGDEVPKVLDFGIAKVAREATTGVRTRGGMMMGTLQYMAPEQAQSARDVDARADQWSMAMVVFECLTGRLPLAETTPEGYLVALLTKPMPSLEELAPEIPSAIGWVLARALQRDPMARYSTIADFADALRNAASTTGIADGLARSSANGAMQPFALAPTVAGGAASPRGSSSGVVAREVDVDDASALLVEVPESPADVRPRRPPPPPSSRRSEPSDDDVAVETADGQRRFGELVRRFVDANDYRSVERAYRRALQRILGKGMTDVEAALWEKLAVVYRDHLGEPESAITALSMAVERGADPRPSRESLADLYARNDRFAEAAEQWNAIVDADLCDTRALAALFDLYRRSGAVDRAWCIAANWSFQARFAREEGRDLMGNEGARALRVASLPREVEAFFEQMRPRQVVPRKRLDDERWIRDLFHPDEDLFIGKILASLTQTVRRIRVQPPARFGLTERERIDLATSPVVLARTFALASVALQCPVPALYVRPQQTGGLGFVPSDPAATVAGNSVLSGWEPAELMFLVGRHLTFYRPEHYLRTAAMFPSVADLTTLLLAAIHIADGDFAVPPNAVALAEQLGAGITQDPVSREALRKIVRLLRQHGEKLDVVTWFRAVEFTACRAGFLLCGDLAVARKVIALDVAAPEDANAFERVRDLAWFSVSERYFRLRAALGIAIEIE